MSVLIQAHTLAGRFERGEGSKVKSRQTIREKIMLYRLYTGKHSHLVKDAAKKAERLGREISRYLEGK